MSEKRGVAFTLGILSIVFAFFQPLAGFVLGIVGLVQNNKDKSKKAKTLNIIGIILSVVLFASILALNIYVAKQTAAQGFPLY